MPFGTDVGLGPGDTVLDGIQLPHGKRHSTLPTSRSMTVVAKQSPILATAELLSHSSWQQSLVYNVR